MRPEGNGERPEGVRSSFSEALPGLLKRVGAIGRETPIEARGLRTLLERRLAGHALADEEIITLLNGAAVKENRALIREVSAAQVRPRAGEIFLLTPLYFASACENGCAYCDFNAKGGRLSLAEFEDELGALIEMGYRSIELVSSQDPQLFRKSEPFHPDRQEFECSAALEYFQRTRRRLDEAGGGLLISNIPPLDAAGFGGLRETGLDVYLSWAECFDTGQYARLHDPRTPKSRQAFRLDAFAAALEAGIPALACAYLKGLFDWRKEEAILYIFDRWLRENRGRGFSIVGTPRLKGPFAADPRVRDYAVRDEDFELILALDRLLFDGVLWLQTREPSDFNHGFIRRYGGGVLMTVDCSTAPGGYRRPSRNRPQFPVHRRAISQAIRQLEDEGFRIVFNWNAETLAGIQRRP